jgi:hypothetical protein
MPIFFLVFKRGELQVIGFRGEFIRMIICEAKVASEEKAVKGFRGINPQSHSRTGYLFHDPLTAFSSPAFGCLTVDDPEIISSDSEKGRTFSLGM